jgi:ATP-dependent DNA helicase RecQ
MRYFGESLDEVCAGCDVCNGARLLIDSTPASIHRHDGRAKPAPALPGTYSALAVEELRRFRRELAGDLAIPPFIIFNDATLFALATALPTNKAEFLAVKGMGASRWERFGVKITQICVLARAAGSAPAPVHATKSRR